MKNQYKPNRIDATVLRETISPEFNLIKTSDTTGGALRHLVPLFTKIQFLPAINQIIASAENELAEEDRIAFENLEKSVAWFHEKIKLLLPYSQRAKDSFTMAEINALINFETVSFNHSGYVGSLLFELRRLFSEVAKEEKNYPIVKQFAALQEFQYPACISEDMGKKSDQYSNEQCLAALCSSECNILR